MANLKLRRALPPHELAANLRRAFSGIVAGNVKDKGIRLIEEHGPYQIHGDSAVMDRWTSCCRPSSTSTA
jgi:hypothetical protein